jgi:hypothetical protein
LGADRLVWGHIEDFNEVNVGIYNKRVIKGQLTLNEKDRAQPLWSGDRLVKNEAVATKSSEIGARFIGALARGLVERIAKKPLGPEAEQFVRSNLEDLPQRPGRD